MRLINLLCFLLIATILVKCTNNTVDSHNTNFTSEQLSHFPKKQERNRISTSLFYPKLSNYLNSGVYIRKAYQFKNSIIDTIADYYKENNLMKVKHTDTCNLYLELYYNHDLNKNHNCKKSIPVPNFWDELIIFDLKKQKYLPDDFDLFIIELKQGEFAPYRNLNNKSDLFGYKEWKNGMSKGIAISKERDICIYWIEMW